MLLSSVPIFLLLSSMIPGIIIFFLKEEQEFLRNFLNLLGVFVKVSLVIVLLYATNNGYQFLFTYEIFSGISFTLKADNLSLLFVTLSSMLWLFTTLYAISYLKNSQNKSLFFGFFSLCVTTTVGLALSGNLITFFIFYELLTLATFPLIFHDKSAKAREGAITYLKYTALGGVLLLIGVIGVYSIAGDNPFVNGGYLESFKEGNSTYLIVVFLFLLFGVGVKAALFPLHGWLPKAMVAPAPVSALLHAVAVVKAGAFGIVRIVYDVYGIEFANSLNLLTILLIFSLTTIIYGSVMAIFQTDIKKRLAYSTVSQVSYIALGISLFGPLGSIGGIVHLVHQGVMKITLFFAAGAFARTYKITKISQMDGLGKRMPLTSLGFTIGALGMIGLPPTAGFVSKWYLALGALENNFIFILLFLGLSVFLNAAYFLPLIYRMWFLPTLDLPREIEPTAGETRFFLFFPPLATAIISLALGVFALSSFGALNFVIDIVESEYK